MFMENLTGWANLWLPDLTIILVGILAFDIAKLDVTSLIHVGNFYRSLNSGTVAAACVCLDLPASSHSKCKDCVLALTFYA